MASNNSVQVAIKLRPLMEKEKDMPSWHVKDNMISLEGHSEVYRFDYAFDETTNNQEIFEKMAKHIVHAAVKGYNGTIFAYGQTSSGKTYTMMGENNDPGVMVLSAKEIFSEIKKTSNTRQFLLRGGFIEIYNEKIFDLLSKKSQELKIHEMANGIPGVNCEEICITNEEQLTDLLIHGNKQRTVGETMMNERSSRSHAIFRLIIESKEINSAEDGVVIQSVLFLVDLAGSERADQTGARGARLKEGGHINKSLLFLSNVIKRLADNEDQKYISFRDSKLTRILQPSLGGNAFVSIICTVKSTAIEETQSTLNFATCAKKIKNKPHVNETIPDATMMKRLTSEIKDLRRQLAEEKQRKTSQLKLSQIKELLDFTELKIINSSMLQNSNAKNDNRRRTWCADTLHEPDTSTSITEQSQSKISRLKQPTKNTFFTPKIGIYNMADTMPTPLFPQPLPPMQHMEAVEEEIFQPSQQFGFGTYPQKISLNSNLPNPDDLYKVSVSPTAKNTSVYVKMLEQELQSLQEFTNLENSVGVKHSHYESLKSTLNELCKRNEELERDHAHSILVKNDRDYYKDQYENSNQRCNELEIQITKLTNSNSACNQKIEQNESDLSKLKATIKQLEIENREAISLQFEFDSHRNKAKAREKDLLELLEEKALEIEKLQKQLEALKAEELHSSKEKLMRLTRYGSSNTSIHDGDSNDHLNGVGSSTETNVCSNCADLQRVLEENNKLTLAFDKLTLQYQELQSSYKQSTVEVDNSKHDSCECEELRSQIVVLRQQLENVVRNYEDIKSECDEKSDRCEAFNLEVEAAQRELCTLQKKYENFENDWQIQEAALANIRIEYTTLEKKYNQLQVSYDELAENSTKCSADCARLLNENDSLQDEIQKLKVRMEKMQQQLLDGLMQNQQLTETTSVQQPLVENLKPSLDDANRESLLRDMEEKCNRLQQENDELSTTLMDNIQENDTLKSECKSLEAKLEELQKHHLESEVKIDLNRMERARKHSVHDHQLLESVKEIVLEMAAGKQRAFVANDFKGIDDVAETITTHYRLSLEHWHSLLPDDNLEYENINDNTEFGLLKAIVSTINSDFMSQENGYSSKNEFEDMKAEIDELQKMVQTLKEKNAALYESSEQNIKEMRDEIVRLTSELFEKSAVLENCSCVEYQKQIDELEKEKSQLTMLNGELQHKMMNSTSENSSSSNISSPNKTVLHDVNVTENVITTEKFESQSLEEKCKCLEVKLKEKEHECQRLQLEQLEKLNLAEDEFRKNMRKYNEDWENKRLEFKQEIEELQTQLEIRNLKHEGNVNFVEETIDENIACELEEKSSTPTHPSERYLEAQQIREERSQIVRACNEKITILSDVIDENKIINLQLIEAVAEKENLIIEKDDKIDQLKNEIESLKLKSMVGSNNDHAEMETLIKETQQESLKLKERYESQKVENELLNKQIVELEIQKLVFEEMELKVIELKLRCEGLENEKASLAEEVQELQNQLEETRVETVTLKAHCERLENEKSLPVQEVQQLKIQLEKWKDDTVNLNLRCDCLEKEKASLVLELQELQTQFEETKQETIKLKAQCECFEKEKVLSVEKVEHLKVQLEEQNSETVKLKSRCEDLNKENTSLSANILEFETLKKILQAASQEIVQWKEECESLIKKTMADKKIIEEDQYNSAIEELQRVSYKNISLLSAEYNSSLEQCMKELCVKFVELVVDFNKQQRRMVENEQKCQNLLTENATLQKNTDENLKIKLQAEEELAILKLLKETLIAENTQLIKDKHILEEKIRKLQVKENSLDELTQERNNLLKELKACEVKYTEKEEYLNQKVGNLIQEVESCEVKRKLDMEEIATLKLRIKDLSSQLQESQLHSTNFDKIRMECEGLKKQLEILKSDKALLKEEINKFTTDNEQFKKLKLRELNANLESKLELLMEERKKLENTISGLQIENKNLSERLETANDIIKKRSDAFESANSSLETDSPFTSPHSRRSPVKSSVNLSSDDKLFAMQMERKNRRLSTHDENRRQSSHFVPLVLDEATDIPQSEKCECAELKEKLLECEQQLYIRKSQVTTLNLQLRNHPLKQENSALLQRIEKEQDKHAESVKKYKHKIDELSKKIVTLQEDILSTAKNTAKLRKITTDRGTSTSPEEFLTTAETQTEFETDFCLQQLQGKYKDLKTLCRYRYTQINNLTKKLEEKENMVSGNNSNNSNLQQKVSSPSEKLKLKTDSK